MVDLKGKTVTVLGGARTGLALVGLLNRLEAKAKLSDASERENLSKDFLTKLESLDVEFELGGHSHSFIEGSDCVVLSPGVSINSDIVTWVKEQNIPVLGEIEFAAQFCDKPIIAITGSNGKTTVTTLISKVIDAAGYKSCLCGNIGFPFSEFVLDLEDTDLVVLEVSSFQLESILDPQSEWRTGSSDNSLVFAGFKPKISVLLNFSQNHLDRHADLNEYFEAKTRIFINQQSNDCAVLNSDQEEFHDLVGGISAQPVFFSEMDEDDLDVNQIAVLKVAEILNIDRSVCMKVFAEFKGVEHRLEWVRDIDGVDFINDSKSTTVEASRWAINSIEKPIVMLCGGRDKNIDYSVLAELVNRKVKIMIVYGEARDKLKKAFANVVDIKSCETLDSAVNEARGIAAAGDCVVLSPMCASFDSFKNFEERGKAFKELVNNLD